MNEISISHESLKHNILRSQHCQRNWDLTKQIPEKDLELLIYAATQCPSKQNMAYYGVHFITNRDIIEKIHSYTEGFMLKDSQKNQIKSTNTQTLANLLIVFEDLNIISKSKKELDIARTPELRLITLEENEFESQKIIDMHGGNSMKNPQFTIFKDMHMAMGIAAGYVNLTANLLGYNTGFCACIRETQEISKLIGIEGNPFLLLGVGFKDNNRQRTEHHLNSELIFPCYEKQKIPMSIIR